MNSQFNLTKNLKVFLREFIYLSEFEDKDNFLNLYGDDFDFVEAEKRFSVIDYLIMIVESNNRSLLKNVKIDYSTVKEFFDSFSKQKIENFPVEENRDFQPLIELPNLLNSLGGTWSGYYTTRPAMKKRMQDFSLIARQLKNYITRIILDMKTMPHSLFLLFDNLDFLTGVFTHHDAIPGCSKKTTVMNYLNYVEVNIKKMEMEFSAINEQHLMDNFFADLRHSFNNEMKQRHRLCEYEHEGDFCKIEDLEKTAHADYILSVVNGVYLNEKKRVNFEIFVGQNITLETVEGDLIAPVSVFRKGSSVKVVGYELALSDKSYITPFIVKIRKSEVGKEEAEELAEFELGESLDLGYGLHCYTSEDSLFLKIGEEREISLSLMRYQGQEKFNKQPSGAYIFHPKYQHPDHIKIEKQSFIDLNNTIIIKLTYSEGYKEVFVKIPKSQFSGKMEIKDNLQIDIDLEVDNLDNDPKKHFSEELIFRISDKKINNNGVFYTDSNGFDLNKRVKSKLKDKFGVIKTKIEENYYPINRIILLNDTQKKGSLVLYTDRPSGASSPSDGCIEIGVQRMARFDDLRGMEEGVIETDKIVKRVKLFWSAVDEKIGLGLARREQIKEESRPILFLRNFAYSQNKAQMGFSSPVSRIFEEDIDGKGVMVNFDFLDNQFYVTLTNMDDDKIALVENLVEKVKLFLYKDIGNVVLRLVEVKAGYLDKEGGVVLENDWNQSLEIFPLDFKFFKIDAELDNIK